MMSNLWAAIRRTLRPPAIWLFRSLPVSVAVKVARGRPNLAYYIRPGNGSVLLKDYLGAFQVRIHLDSGIARRMASGVYEPATEAIMARFVSPGQSAFDIGANVGAVTLALAKAVGPLGRVYAFEPGLRYLRRLEENLEINPALNFVQTYELAMGDREGEQHWQESESDPGNATMHWLHMERPTTFVKVTTLDRFVEANAISSIDFLKIDVEGMEREVLRGAAETLRRFQPIVYFESSLCDEDQRAGACESAGLLESLGYRLYRVGEDGTIRATHFPDLSLTTLALPPNRLVES